MPTTASPIQRARRDADRRGERGDGRLPQRAPAARAASASRAVLDEREQQQRFGDDEEEQRRREPDDGDGEGDEHGAAQDAGHFAPSATGAAGDGLMPPYRRSRF